jgi:hypothetical protein
MSRITLNIPQDKSRQTLADLVASAGGKVACLRGRIFEIAPINSECEVGAGEIVVFARELNSVQVLSMSDMNR